MNSSEKLVETSSDMKVPDSPECHQKWTPPPHDSEQARHSASGAQFLSAGARNLFSKPHSHACRSGPARAAMVEVLTYYITTIYSRVINCTMTNISHKHQAMCNHRNHVRPSHVKSRTRHKKEHNQNSNGNI